MTEKKTATIEIKDPKKVILMLTNVADESWDEDYRDQLNELKRLIEAQMEGYSETSTFKQIKPFQGQMPAQQLGRSISAYNDRVQRLVNGLKDAGFFSVKPVPALMGNGVALDLKLYEDAMPFYLQPNEFIDIDDTHCFISYAGSTASRLTLDLREGKYV